MCRHCCALHPRKVDGERKAWSEGASCLRQGESVISLVGEEKREVGLNESWVGTPHVSPYSCGHEQFSL